MIAIMAIALCARPWAGWVSSGGRYRACERRPRPAPSPAFRGPIPQLGNISRINR
jgi:hypothetical protein